MGNIQAEMSERALELLALPDEPCYVLDLGCGSGLSGECCEEQGHMWVGLDISQAMLDVARERELEGDLACSDPGHLMELLVSVPYNGYAMQISPTTSLTRDST